MLSGRALYPTTGEVRKANENLVHRARSLGILESDLTALAEAILSDGACRSNLGPVTTAEHVPEGSVLTKHRGSYWDAS